MSLESEVARGTTFKVWLPAAREAGDAAAEGSAAVAGEPEASLAERVGHPFTGRLFVVVDDDLRVLDAMRSMLEAWGAEVIVAANVDDVVSSLERTRPRPDLVIADHHLDPRTTGLDAIEVIRRTLGCNVPALAITAETSADAVGAIRAAGLPVLTKPVKPARLRAMIAELVG